MGLFDMFKSDAGDKMTPHLAFTCALLHIMHSDGQMDPEEVGQLLAVIGGKDDGRGTIGVGAQAQQLLQSAQNLLKSKGYTQILAEAAPILTDAQKICILVNMVDSSLSDGQPEPQEQQIFGQTLQAFGISEERFRPFFEVIVLKNDRSVFTNQNHPKNAPGFQVKLA